jgi:DNA-binding NtrC family response regulator
MAEVKIPIIMPFHLEQMFGKVDSKVGQRKAAPPEDQDAITSAVDSLLENNLPLASVMEQLERRYLTRAKEKFQSTREMANAIGYSPATLKRRLSDLGITLRK